MRVRRTCTDRTWTFENVHERAWRRRAMTSDYLCVFSLRATTVAIMDNELSQNQRNLCQNHEEGVCSFGKTRIKLSQRSHREQPASDGRSETRNTGEMIDRTPLCGPGRSPSLSGFGFVMMRRTRAGGRAWPHSGEKTHSPTTSRKATWNCAFSQPTVVSPPCQLPIEAPATTPLDANAASQTHAGT
jgi:hypothetical protein